MQKTFTKIQQHTLLIKTLSNVGSFFNLVKNIYKLQHT